MTTDNIPAPPDWYEPGATEPALGAPAAGCDVHRPSAVTRHHATSIGNRTKNRTLFSG